MSSARERDAMRRALELAASVDLLDDPNPRVGAVVLSPSGEVLGEGLHRGAGTPHAEVAALQAAGPRAAGATVVVTLEPCNHVGRTGPCSEALLAAGVQRVVYGQDDPNPVAAGGADELRLAGIDVEGGLLASEAAALNFGWAPQRPSVIWKIAATLDGRAAAVDGSSRWITGEQARADVHRLRASCDTVLVGAGTVAADNPRLTARDSDGQPLGVEAQPLRAVMGLRALDRDLLVFDRSAPTVHLRTRDPAQALAALAALGRRQVLLEGGPTLAAAFLRAGLVDEVIAYVAPALLGSGPSAVGDLGIGAISDVLRLELCDVERVGDDVRLTLKLVDAPRTARTSMRRR